MNNLAHVMYFYNYMLGTDFYKWQYCFVCNLLAITKFLFIGTVPFYTIVGTQILLINIFCLIQPKFICFLQIIILIDTLVFFLIVQVLRFCPTVYPCWTLFVKPLHGFMIYLYQFFYIVPFHSLGITYKTMEQSFIKLGYFPNIC